METQRAMFTRPLVLSIFVSVGLELVTFFFYALMAETSHSLLTPFIWIVGFGGIGMGAVLGVLLDLILVGRVTAKDGIKGTILLAALTMGVTAKLLTVNFAPVFHDLSGTNALVYFISGVTTAIGSGFILGWLVFTEEGGRIADKLGV
ncbi:MAG: hypothetical protein MI864_28055 [Pseudomonadales bacterium]|nr:hypothetical protein [Pseudomonadales bacterium]